MEPTNEELDQLIEDLDTEPDQVEVPTDPTSLDLFDEDMANIYWR